MYKRESTSIPETDTDKPANKKLKKQPDYYKEKNLVFVDCFDSNLTTFPSRCQEGYVKCYAKSIPNITLLKHFSTIDAMNKLQKFYKNGTEENQTISLKFIQNHSICGLEQFPDQRPLRPDW